MAHINDLPVDLKFMIFDELNCASKADVAETCRTWQGVAKANGYSSKRDTCEDPNFSLTDRCMYSEHAPSPRRHFRNSPMTSLTNRFETASIAQHPTSASNLNQRECEYLLGNNVKNGKALLAIYNHHLQRLNKKTQNKIEFSKLKLEKRFGKLSGKKLLAPRVLGAALKEVPELTKKLCDVHKEEKSHYQSDLFSYVDEHLSNEHIQNHLSYSDTVNVLSGLKKRHNLCLSSESCNTSTGIPFQGRVFLRELKKKDGMDIRRIRALTPYRELN